jgi:hypothetical protein
MDTTLEINACDDPGEFAFLMRTSLLGVKLRHDK